MPDIWLTPGPTPIPPNVLEAQSRHPVFHRGRGFQHLLAEVTSGLQWILETSDDVLVLTGSGTGALEASIVNVFSPGERVLICVNGFFGERVATIADRFGLVVERLDYDWGRAVRAEDVEEALERLHGVSGVVLQHSETSTGVVNDLAAIAAAVHGSSADPLLVVDAVSAAGAIPVRMDALGLDLVCGASQKALGATPGIGFVAVSERAWLCHDTSTSPRYYWDFSEYRAWMKPDGIESPWTPAVSVLEGLAASLRLLREAPLKRTFDLHRLNAAAVKAGVQALGLELFGENAETGVIVTAVRSPEGVHPSALADHLKQHYGTVIAAGQGPLSKDVFRIGHLGYVSAADVVAGLGALEAALADLTGSAVAGAGVAAAVGVYRSAAAWPQRPPLGPEHHEE